MENGDSGEAVLPGNKNSLDQWPAPCPDAEAADAPPAPAAGEGDGTVTLVSWPSALAAAALLPLAAVGVLRELTLLGVAAGAPLGVGSGAVEPVALLALGDVTTAPARTAAAEVGAGPMITLGRWLGDSLVADVGELSRSMLGTRAACATSGGSTKLRDKHSCDPKHTSMN